MSIVVFSFACISAVAGSAGTSFAGDGAGFGVTGRLIPKFKKQKKNGKSNVYS